MIVPCLKAYPFLKLHENSFSTFKVILLTLSTIAK